ncbi:uncharacterized protein LOC132044011 [Lycium ferocissimum]|uniref:uncharacterized protein LOC132044011 n=1 Tax=Lycium ferocissimum TaxID=112874 RepID=UPI002815A9C9|nr:uncharacterized protein LOC132044011 [Lycium ferocissimum]
MKNRFFLCFRPINVAEDSVILKHRSSVKRHHKEDSTLKTKGKRSTRRDKSLKKAGSSSSVLSYSTSSLSSSSSSSSCSTTEDELLSRSNSSSSYDQKEAKNGSAECDKVYYSSSFWVYLFIFILCLLIYIGKVYAIVVTSFGVMFFTLVGNRKLENRM